MILEHLIWDDHSNRSSYLSFWVMSPSEAPGLLLTWRVHGILPSTIDGRSPEDCGPRRLGSVEKKSAKPTDPLVFPVEMADVKSHRGGANGTVMATGTRLGTVVVKDYMTLKKQSELDESVVLLETDLGIRAQVAWSWVGVHFGRNVAWVQA